MNLVASDTVSYEKKLLEAVEVGVRTTLNHRLVADSSVSVQELGFMGGENLALQLERHLLRDHIDTDTQRVFFETTALVHIDLTERYWKWYFIPWKRTRSHSRRVPVTGTVNVEARYYHTFPEAEIDYSKILGGKFRYVEYKQDEQSKRGYPDV